MPGKLLDAEDAMRRARSLTLLVDFPRRYEEAVGRLAGELIELCRGKILERCYWTPEEQADWLVSEALRTWEQWRGVAALRALFYSKFDPKKGGLERQVLDYGQKPAVECTACKDSGYTGVLPHLQYCACRLGRNLAEMGPEWLKKVNQVKSIPALPARRLITEADIDALKAQKEEPE
jgi:hypothetical protein